MPATAARRILPLAIVLTLGAAHSVRAETSAEALKQKIQQRSQNIKEFRALLNDPDQTVRLAALDTMLKSDDIAMRELAYGICFNSADQAMRVVCLKNRFSDLQTLAIKIGEIDDPTDQQAKALAAWGGVYNCAIKDYDEKTGRFSCGGSSYYQGDGQITGTTVVLSARYCNVSMKLDEDGVLEGELGCNGNWSGTYPGRVRLQ